MQPEQPIAVPFEAPVEKKKGSGSIIAMVGLGILAVAGIGFGIYGLMKEPEVKVETKVEPKVSLASATNIVSPYLRSLIPYATILDGMDDGAKIMLAYRNVPSRLVSTYDKVKVGYEALDEEYHKLFGEHLAKADTTAISGVTFSYTEYVSGYGEFEVEGDAFGGIMPIASVAKVKEASETADGLTITVYYDNVAICEYVNSPDAPDGVTEEYCISNKKFDAAGVTEFVESHEEMIPTVEMSFKEVDGRYVLTGLTKKSTK